MLSGVSVLHSFQFLDHPLFPRVGAYVTSFQPHQLLGLPRSTTTSFGNVLQKQTNLSWQHSFTNLFNPSTQVQDPSWGFLEILCSYKFAWPFGNLPNFLILGGLLAPIDFLGAPELSPWAPPYIGSCYTGYTSAELYESPVLLSTEHLSLDVFYAFW